MGLDIGFVEKVNFKAPRPGWDFGEELATIANDVDDGTCYLTLREIQEVHREFKTRDVEQGSLDSAQRFVDWCVEYWKTRGMEKEDGITVLFSS